MSEKTPNLIPIPKREAAHYDAALSRQENVIGRKIEEARHAKGLSLRKLAELLHERGVDCDYQAIHKWEKGTTAPNIYQVLAVCDALEIPDAFAYFMGCGSGLNAEGMKKLLDYRDDLLASGRYMPAPTAQKDTVKYIEMPVSLLDASAGTGEFLDEENIVMMRFPESSVPLQQPAARRGRHLRARRLGLHQGLRRADAGRGRARLLHRQQRRRPRQARADLLQQEVRAAARSAALPLQDLRAGSELVRHIGLVLCYNILAFCYGEGFSCSIPPNG